MFGHVSSIHMHLLVQLRGEILGERAASISLHKFIYLKAGNGEYNLGQARNCCFALIAIQTAKSQRSEEIFFEGLKY